MSEPSRPKRISVERNRENLELAQNAAENDVSARKKVNELISPIIQYQTNRFCKRFCKENRVYFKCTLNPPINNNDANLCEWGNGSYAWMLDDLSNSNRLKKYKANNNATLFNYCYVIANSLPFYERWKDWRFGRKVYVPAYIRDLGKLAVTVFFGLRSQQSHELIAQAASQSVSEVQNISRRIIQLLIQKNKLHLLKPSHAISLTGALTDEQENDQAQSAIEAETATYDEAIDTIEDKNFLSLAWKELSPIEQFVIEALVIDEQDAQIVLNTLKKLKLSIKKGINADMTNRQQLYYFRRKTLAKLHKLIETQEKRKNA